MLIKRGLSMKAFVLCALVGLTLFAALVAAQTNTTPKQIPEEARRHFVMGETIFKEAKNATAFSQAVAEFKEAARLAPQWPEARYNLALAKEAAGDYSGAMADLKLYQQFKLSDIEARKVQDKIYAIEGKQKMVVDEAASNAAAVERRAREQQQQIIGRWDYGEAFGSGANYISISGPYSASLSAGFLVRGSTPPQVRVEGGTDLSDFRIRGRNVEFTATTNEVWHITSGRQRVDQHWSDTREFRLFLSEDGRSLTGNFVDHGSAEGTDFPTTTTECKFSRHD
jgi:hypothetical protein